MLSTKHVPRPTSPAVRGPTKVGVIWELSVTKIDDKTWEFMNAIHTSATPELLDFLGKQGIPWDVFRTARCQRLARDALLREGYRATIKIAYSQRLVFQ